MRANTHEPPVLTPSRLRDFNRAQESIDVALEQVERFEDAADDERHWAEIDAMTHDELLAYIGTTDDEIAARVTGIRGNIASYDVCAGCGEPALVEGGSTYESDDSIVGQSWVTSVCGSCFFTHGESAVAGEG